MVRREGYRSRESSRDRTRRMTQATLECLRRRKEQAKRELRELGRDSQSQLRASLHDDAAVEERKNLLHGIIANIGSLNRVRIIQPRERTGRVGVGNRVTLEFNGGVRETYTVLGDDDAQSIDQSNVISYKSPIGSAVLGKRPGETATANLPEDRRIKVKVHKIEPGGF